MTRLSTATTLLFVLIALASCESDEPSAVSLLGGGCRLNSDCSGGLTCAYGVCHQECATSKDCEAGRCILGPEKVHLCQPDGTAACTFNSDCLEPLLCAADGECRNECAADRDCVSGQSCVSATCADPDELDADGELPVTGDPVGKPCLYASDCGTPPNDLTLVCRDATCTYACYDNRDCGRYLLCTSEDPDAPGDCELIGPADTLVCDPRFDEEKPCFCTDGPSTATPCKDDGSGYKECCL